MSVTSLPRRVSRTCFSVGTRKKGNRQSGGWQALRQSDSSETAERWKTSEIVERFSVQRISASKRVRYPGIGPLRAVFTTLSAGRTDGTNRQADFVIGNQIRNT